MFLFTAITSLNNRLLAYNFGDDSGLNGTAEKTGFIGLYLSAPITTQIGYIVSALLSLVGVIFLGLIVYAGVLWMLAEGDEAKVEKAKQILIQAITGLIIVLAAYAISLFVISALAPK